MWALEISWFCTSVCEIHSAEGADRLVVCLIFFLFQGLILVHLLLHCTQWSLQSIRVVEGNKYLVERLYTGVLSWWVKAKMKSIMLKGESWYNLPYSCTSNEPNHTCLQIFFLPLNSEWLWNSFVITYSKKNLLSTVGRMGSAPYQ